jgi:hypothetical protein
MIVCVSMIDVYPRGQVLFSLVALSAAVWFGAPQALAQSDAERAGARAAATEGAKAFEEGRFKEAVDLFARAESLVHAPPHLLYIARSHEKLGQLVEARESYLKITREQLSPDAPAAFKQARTSAEQELAALEPRIPYLTITVTGPGAQSATVTMDGDKVPRALVGVPHPVNPGEHELLASGQDVKSPPQKVALEEGGRKSIELVLAAAPGSTGSAGPVTGAGDGGDQGVSEGGSSGMRIGAYVALGVGVVGLAGGTFFALRASSKRSEADDLCNLPGGACPQDKRGEVSSLDDDADSASTLATVSFIVGGVGIASGLTLLLLSSGESSTSKGRGIQPWIGLGAAGVSGRF